MTSTVFKPDVVVCDSAAEMCAKGYEVLTGIIDRSATPVSVGLSGGSTPKALYEMLHDKYLETLVARETRFFFGDDRLVPPEDDRSNYHMAHKALLHAYPATHVLAVDPGSALALGTAEDATAGEAGAAIAAAQYQKALEAFLPGSVDVALPSGTAHVPVADVVLLGFGSDGHTASIFPGSAAESVTERAVTCSFPSPTMSPKVWRVTVTKTLIQQARHVIVLAGGKDKAWVIQGLLADHPPADRIPVARFLRECKGTVTIILDKASSSSE